MASSFLKQKARERAEKLEKEYGPSAYGGTTWLNEQINGKKKKEDDDIAPVRTTTTKEDDRKWFEKGAFEDGYQFGDVFKTILGTGQDVHENLFEGAYGIVEKAVDAGAYLVGGAAGLMGADKFRDKTEAFIEKDLIDEERWAKFAAGTTLPGFITKILSGGKETDDMSVLGEKSDALVQSGGQLAATIGLQSVGVPWWVTSGVTGFGGEAESALKEGATYGEAGLSAGITAAAEILTEKLFGGSGLGETGLINVEALTKGIARKGLKLALDYGIDVVGEGAEEVFSQFFSNLGTALYKEENLKDILFSEEALDGYLESAIGGMALGGVMNVGNVRQSVKTGKDYRTGLTTNEQKVVDKEVENRIAEQEKDGKKLTNKEKAVIEEAVLRDMERGYISTDTIEEVLGGETYKTHKDTIESEKAMQEEYDTLYQMKTGDKSDAQIDRQAELKQKLEDIKQNFNRNQLRDEVMSMVKGDRLAESYNERSRRGQAFEADISKYDAKQQATIQKAIDSGILNNTNRTHEFVDMVAKITADKGVLFDFTNNERLKESGFAVDGKTVNGFVTKDGVTLNIDSAKALNRVVGHEITHVLEGTEMYTALQSVVTEYSKTKGEYQGRYDALAKLYEGVDGADVDAELTADLVGDYLFSDTDFVRHLSVTNRNVFQKIYDEIKYLYKIATAGSKEARELEKVKRTFEKIYKEGGKAQTDTKYSLSDSDGKQLSKEQQDYFKDSKMRDENGNLKVMYHGSQDAGFHVFDSDMSDDGRSFFFVDRNDVAASYSGTTETYEAASFRTAEEMNGFFERIGKTEYEVIEKDGKYRLRADEGPVYYTVAESDSLEEIYQEFCDYEGVGYGDANYKVYLNLTNPLVVDAEGRNWNRLPSEFSKELYNKYKSLTAEERTALVELAEWEDWSLFKDEVQMAREGASNGAPDALSSAIGKLMDEQGDINISNLFSIASANFTEEAIAENAFEYLNTRQYAQRAKEQGYDGVIFNNIVDNGGYSNGDEGASTVAIAFDSNQIKSVANEKPTSDPDIRFSLSEPVEQTKDLMALHNLTEQKLLKSLQLGGLPMPSVAIAKANDGHSEFGEISLVLPRDTIDPEYSRKNKLYSGDAWTPTYPRVEYKVNDKVRKAISDKIKNLVPYETQDALGGLHLDADNMNDTLNRNDGDMVEAFKRDDVMKYAYLKDIGADISLPVTEANLAYYGRVSNAAVRYFSGKLVNGLQTVELYQNMGASALMQDDALKEAVADAQNWDVLQSFEPGSSEYMEYERNPVFKAEEVSFSDIDDFLSACRKLFTSGIQQTIDKKAARELIRGQVNQSEYEAWLNDLSSGIVEKEGIRNNKDYFTPSGNRRSFEALHYEHNLENVIRAMQEKGEKGIGFGGGSIFGAATTEFSSVEEMKQESDRLQKMSDEEYQEMRDGFTNRFFEIAGSLPKNKSSFMATDDAANTLIEAVSKYKTRSGIANYLRRELNGWATYSEQAVDDLIELVRDIRKMPTGYFEAKPQRAVGFEEVGVFVIPNNADVKLKQELLNRGYSIAEYDPNIEGHRQQVVNQFEEYKFSLSNVGEQFAPRTRFDVFGKDLMKAEEIAPVREAETAEAMFPDDLAPIVDDPERFDSLTDADAPPVRKVEYGEHGNQVTMPKSAVNVIAQNVKESLAISDRQMGIVHRLIDNYAKAEFPSREQLFRDLKDNFGAYTEKGTDEAIQEVKSVLRKYRLNVPDSIKSEIADYDFLRRQNFGKVLFSRQGTDVDVAYQELSNMFPGFFPKDIISPTDQLMQIIDVANKSSISEQSFNIPDEHIWYVTDDIIESVRDYQYTQMEKDAGKVSKDYVDDLVKHGDEYAPDGIAPVAETKAEVQSKTVHTTRKKLADEIRSLNSEMGNNERLREQSNADFDREIARLQAEYDALGNKNTIRANDLLRRIERTRRMKNNVDGDYARRIHNLEERIEKMSSATYQTATQRKAKQQAYADQMESLVGDTTYWRDKKLGISYKINTLRRNLRDVVRKADGSRDIEKADAIYDELQGKYNHNEAILNREASQIKQPYADMKITKAEDAYIQMLGELRHNPDTTLTEDVVKAFYEQHKGSIDTAKVDRAIDMARKTYDELLVRVNEVLREQGMKEIPYRKGYFPHFTEDKQSFLAKLFNWKTHNNDIPTDIAGLTENFNPNRSWQSFNKERTSDTTDYSFMKGMDTYVQGSLDWIHHIEDIQKRRAFENHLRYIHSEQGVKDKIEAIKKSEEYDADEMQEQIDLVYKNAQNPLNNFVVDLRAGTNTLANKKSSMDRSTEDATNRKIYSVMTNISSRVSANMVGGSISSALTNFIPITQSWGQVSPVSSLRAMADTIRSTFRDDGTINKSDFLTNRLRKADNLYKSGWDKVSDGLGVMFDAVDSFTSQTVWRSKYLENISNGMSESEAIKNADQFAENVMAGRSRGNQPTAFDAKNPFSKMFTAFQLEVNNQYGYMFKDMPQDMRNETKAKLIKGYVSMFVGAYAYNALTSMLTGRDAAFDPIGIFEDLLRDLGLFGDDEEEEEIAPVDVVMNLTENVLQEVPFVGGLMGGGRVPISSALPYDGNVMDTIEGASKLFLEGDTSDLTSEWLKPVYYLGLPVGGGQIKKTVEGLSMFSDDHPIAGSYTKSGNLRFPVDDTIGSRVKAGLFGQYASKNAREYFDNGYAPLKEKQIQEFIDLDIPIRDYWEYREGLSGLSKLGEKADYIADLDLPIAKKNLLINNIADREEDIDLTGYDDFSDFEEFDFAVHNPEKYKIAQTVGGYDAYVKYQDGMKGMKLTEKVDYVAGLNLTDAQKNALINGETDRKEPIDLTGYNTFDYSSFEEFEFSKENPGRYGVAKAVGGYEDYTGFMDAIGEFDSKNANGETVSGLKKERVTAYINGLDLDYGQKIILYRSLYDSKADRATYDSEIFNYLLSRDDLSYEEKVEILKKLGFSVSADGYVTW